jgi:hypothetical protein
MNDCNNCGCRSSEIVRAGGCPRRDHADPSDRYAESVAVRYPDPLEPHPLARWRELQGPVIAVLIVFVFTTGVGLGAWLERLP